MKRMHTQSRNVQDAAPAPGASDPPAVVETPLVSAQELNELKKRAAQADENWDRLLRATADFENFKKRVAREKQDAVKFGNETLLQSLIPVLDNFDMAMAAAQNAGEAT